MKNRLFNPSLVAHLIAAIGLERKSPPILSNKRVGIWVDSRKAFIVSVVKDRADDRGKPATRLIRIDADVQSRFRLADGAANRKPPSGLRDMPEDGRTGAKRRRQLQKYFQEIIRNVEDAEKILIFGPGRAKLELEKRFRKYRRFDTRVLPVETTDKMTVGQITEKVKAFFNSEFSEKG